MADRFVLYIEDNFHNRRIVNKVLASKGIRVVEAEDGEKGLDMVRELIPPLVLLDITLPGIDGIEVVKRMKADDVLRHIPVIAVTASAMRGDRERFLEAGCDDYLSKPIQVTELAEMVDKHYPAH
ncbi:MAG: response regulator [Chloroflexi bacterium]|nr:response regulator [Chloroflexi bacterium CFX2]MCQ3937259.1 response regulator [Chloroflexota bacterium]MDL1943503.1 response regulator [Chloroflexi bacterium CFX2]